MARKIVTKIFINLFEIPDNKFRFIVSLFLFLMVMISVFGVLFKSFDTLFNVVLAFLGIFAGLLTSVFLAKIDMDERLQQYSSIGAKITFDIHDSLKGVIQEVNKRKIKLNKSKSVPVDEVQLILDGIVGELLVLQRFSLSSNEQWKEILPPQRIQELQQREETINLVEHNLQITRSTFKIHKNV